MLLATRMIGTALLAFTLALGWPLLFSAAMGYVWISVPVLLAAWAAAWFGDEVGDLIKLGHDGAIRWLGLCMLAVMALIVASVRWQGFR